jgi:hypothetical protein
MSSPYLWVREPGQVRVQVELDAFSGPWQRDPSDQEDQKHNIGEGRSDIYDLFKREERNGDSDGLISLSTTSSSSFPLLHIADCLS